MPARSSAPHVQAAIQSVQRARVPATLAIQPTKVKGHVPLGRGPASILQCADSATAEGSIEGSSDFGHEHEQAKRFIALEGAGKFQFIGSNSQGIEGFWTPSGGSKIGVSFKDFSQGKKTAKAICQEVIKNSQKCMSSSYAPPFWIFVTTQLSQKDMKQGIRNYPGNLILIMPSEKIDGVSCNFTRLIFECPDGTFVIDESNASTF